MLTGTALDAFMDAFWENEPQDAAQKEDKGDEELEEYTLPTDGMIIRPVIHGKVDPRTWVSLLLMLVTVPILLYILVKYYHGRKYLLISLLVVLCATMPFFLVFEGRRPQAREIMVISVLAAIGVAGRAAFYMLPHFKPIAAVVILTGISFGGEAGFLVGCMIVLVSNMFAGQGPWSPWQMFAYGMIGFLAGILFQKGILKPKLPQLCLYGFLSVVFIFGGIMNPASILMGYGMITKETLLAYYISGLPMDLVQASATVVFLCLLSRPMLEKLERIKRKYGLIQKESENGEE